MILIGQFDSPFVRRVGIALRLYDLTFDHRPWSVFGDAERITAYNPLIRVPTLILDDGEVLIDTVAILDHLDETVGEARALIDAAGPSRRRTLRIAALAGGLAEKAVSLIYERALHDTVSTTWTERCQGQIANTLAALEQEPPRAGFLGAARPSHADIAIACAVRFLIDAHPALFNPADHPRLDAHRQACELLPEFAAISQVFIPPR